MELKILYPIIDGEITGGNIVALRIIEEVLKRGGKAVVNSPSEGKFTQLLRKKGVRVYSIDTGRIYRLDSVIKLAGVIKKEGINLVHTHAPLAGTILSCWGGWLAGVPVVNHVHAPYFMNPNPIIRGFQLLLNRITSRLFSVKVIAVSEFVKSELIGQGVPVKKIITVYNGIDSAGFKDAGDANRIRQAFGLLQGQFIIGEVGRLGNDKGQHILIQAAKKVIADNPDAAFMIVGEDLTQGRIYREKLEKLAGDLGLKKQIVFTGYRRDIAELMSTFDIFVLPSTFYEGLPVVILEAMAAKKAVITTTVGGNPEIVVDGQTGKLVPPLDADKLAEAITYCISHPQALKEMGEEGYRRVKQYFSLSEMLDKIMEIYNEALLGK